MPQSCSSCRLHRREEIIDARTATALCSSNWRSFDWSPHLVWIVHAELCWRLCNFVQGMVFDDIPRHRARSHGERRCQIHLARPAASGKVAVLRADHHLIGARRYARPRIDARATTGLDHTRAGFFENLDVTPALRVFARFLRTELNPELDI